MLSTEKERRCQLKKINRSRLQLLGFFCPLYPFQFLVFFLLVVFFNFLVNIVNKKIMQIFIILFYFTLFHSIVSYFLHLLHIMNSTYIYCGIFICSLELPDDRINNKVFWDLFCPILQSTTSGLYGSIYLSLLTSTIFTSFFEQKRLTNRDHPLDIYCNLCTIIYIFLSAVELTSMFS